MTSVTILLLLLSPALITQAEGQATMDEISTTSSKSTTSDIHNTEETSTTSSTETSATTSDCNSKMTATTTSEVTTECSNASEISETNSPNSYNETAMTSTHNKPFHLQREFIIAVDVVAAVLTIIAIAVIAVVCAIRSHRKKRKMKEFHPTAVMEEEGNQHTTPCDKKSTDPDSNSIFPKSVCAIKTEIPPQQTCTECTYDPLYLEIVPHCKNDSNIAACRRNETVESSFQERGAYAVTVLVRDTEDVQYYSLPLKRNEAYEGNTITLKKNKAYKSSAESNTIHLIANEAYNSCSYLLKDDSSNIHVENDEACHTVCLEKEDSTIDLKDNEAYNCWLADREATPTR